MKIDRFKIEEWMNKYEASAKYDLCATTIKPFSISELLELCDKSNLSDIDCVPLGYGDILGSERLLNSISKLYEHQNINNVALTHGAIGANQLVFLSLIEPNDEVISIIPNYQQHSSIPKSLGANVVEILLREENEWIIDIDEIKSKITPKTRLITFSNPNNPTGSVIPDEKILELVTLADKYGIWILADEVYRGLNLFGNRYSKALCDIYGKGISVCSMSKTYSLPGVRIGWICANENLIKTVNSHRQYNTISIGLVDDYLSSLALENKEKIEMRNFDILYKNYDIVKSLTQNDDYIRCVLPKGGTTIFVKYKADIPSEKLCKKFQDETGIALLPGSLMGIDGFVRVGFGISSYDLEYSLKKFSEFNKAH